MRSVSLLLALTLCSVAAFAQTATGTITGTLSDPAGAVVANGALELKNSETGTVSQTVSSSTGNYSFSQLPAGTYQLTVNVPGFKTHVRQNLGVQAAQTIRVDIILEVGTSVESVTVSAQASMLTTESGAVNSNVTTDRMNSLPILGVGGATASTHGVRNPLASSVLSAGVFWVPNTSMRVNGAPTNTFGIKLDGQDITNGVNTSNSQAQMQPSVDALEEVAIQASNYSAEFGQAGSGLIQYTTKSGTNSFHGSAYDYFVNEALWAHQSLDHLRNKQRRNDFGGTLGGPILIPKIYNGRDKTFFFFNFEQFRESSIITNQVKTVPTLAYRGGDFSGLLTGRAFTGALATDGLGNTMKEGMIFDPLTERIAPNGTRARLQYTGNQIPITSFDPSAVKIQNFIPKPNLGAAGQSTGNFVNAFPSERVTPIPSIKIDHSFSARFKISGYWSSTSTEVAYAPGGFALSEGFPDEITQTRGTYIYSRTWRGNLDYTVTPTMLLHFGAGYVVNDFSDKAPITDFDMAATFGISGGTLGPKTGARPPVIQSMLGAAGTAVAGFGGMEVMGPATGQVRSLLQRPTGNLSLSWVKGNHSYKFGGEVRFDGYPVATATNTSGNFTFSAFQTYNTFFQPQGANLGGLFVGFPYASFLLGRPLTVTLAQPTNTRGGRGFYAWFAQDTWKVTRKLTVDYGIRWDLFTYPREQYGRSPSLSASLPNANAGGHPGATIYEATCNCRFAKNYPWAYAPRLGVSYQLAPKTVLRGAFGLSYSMSQGGGQGSAGADTLKNNANFGDPAIILSQGINLATSWPDLRPNLFPASATSPGAGPAVVDPNYGRPARMLQYNFGIQREISRDLVVEASYVGNRGVWWRTASLTNYNALTPQGLLSNYGLDWSNAADRSILSAQVGSAAAGRFQNKIPYAGFPTTQTVAQSLRPFPQFSSGLGATGAPLGKTWYDSLQLKATKRFSHGLDFTFTYTRSKELQLGAEDYTGLGIINDVFNRDNNKQLSASSRPNWMTLAANYTTPRWGQNQWLSYALRDWMVGAVLQYGSGLPIPTPASPNNNNSSTLLRSTYATRLPGVPLFLKDLNCHCFDPSTTQVLNPAAWTDTPSGTFSPSAAYYNDFRYQRRPAELMSFGRTFRIRERASFTVRAEFNNIFNRPLLLGTTAGTYINPGTALGTLPTPNSAKDPRFKSGFGTINTLGTVSGERQGTLVARITF
ncbi:MAG TPA: TonB-dependent receptor [Bryobacteraceae bacterium]|nr:TonB-dependent receptor [Bryobacteraceae bacterium]